MLQRSRAPPTRPRRMPGAWSGGWRAGSASSSARRTPIGSMGFLHSFNYFAWVPEAKVAGKEKACSRLSLIDDGLGFRMYGCRVEGFRVQGFRV